MLVIYGLMRVMMTKEQIAKELADVNVELLSKVSGVSVKTIYRHRKANSKHLPSLATLGKLLAAVDKLSKAAKVPA